LLCNINAFNPLQALKPLYRYERLIRFLCTRFLTCLSLSIILCNFNSIILHVRRRELNRLIAFNYTSVGLISKLYPLNNILFFNGLKYNNNNEKKNILYKYIILRCYICYK
jgi:hypothetical protein